MKRGIVCLTATLAYLGYHALGHITLLAVAGVNPWPAIRTLLALTVGFAAALAIAIEWRTNRSVRR